ncbi:hypothetical protein KJ763_02305 [Patescibacteria group bacterium]|nr:hypothetical protein [Patescibacteria group bacterium]
MDQDIQSQLDRANELLQDLEKACNDDFRQKIFELCPTNTASGKNNKIMLKIITSMRD